MTSSIWLPQRQLLERTWGPDPADTAIRPRHADGFPGRVSLPGVPRGFRRGPVGPESTRQPCTHPWSDTAAGARRHHDRPRAMRGDRSDGIHRRAPRPTSGGGGPRRALRRARPREDARHPVGAAGGDRRGRRPRRGVDAPRLRGRRRPVLPRALALRARLRRGRPPRRADQRAGRPRGRRVADRLPRRHAPRGRRALRAPRVARRGRRDLPALGRPDRHPAGGGDPRVGVGELRDAALPHRAPARDAHAVVGAPPRPAHRHPRRPALPGQGGDAAARDQPDVRHRRPRRPDLPGDDGGLRRGGASCRDGRCCRSRC